MLSSPEDYYFDIQTCDTGTLIAFANKRLLDSNTVPTFGEIDEMTEDLFDQDEDIQDFFWDDEDMWSYNFMQWESASKAEDVKSKLISLGFKHKPFPETLRCFDND